MGEKLGGGFKDFLCSPRNLGEMIQFDVRIFSDGLIQPPTRKNIIGFFVAETMQMGNIPPTKGHRFGLGFRGKGFTIFFWVTIFQLMVNCWFGAFSGLGC